MSIQEFLEPGSWLSPKSGPRYIQLRRRLEAAINEGQLPPGAPLPPEREIAAITKLSRVTVRNAVRPLVEEGLIVQRRGSGSVVAPAVTKVEQSLSRLTSFSEDMATRGLSVTSDWLSRGIFYPTPEETMVLGLPATASVTRLSRLRFADGVPLAIERATLATEVLPDPYLVKASLYAVLDQMHLKPARASQRISAMIIDPEDAALLQVGEHSAGLKITRVSFLTSGRAVELTHSIYRGDAYDFVAELKLPGDE